jgi:hypothetical protein
VFCERHRLPAVQGHRLDGDPRRGHGAPQRARGTPAYDSERYTGFAFGLGIDRIAMLRYGVDDLAHLFKSTCASSSSSEVRP